jgi:uncharacterized protein YndB with AHSA1/START domain
MKIIKKTIEIKASPERVWQALVDDALNRKWYAAFSEGTYAVTDWTPGSKVLFIDHSDNGMVGQIETNRPGEYLSVEYTGFYANGVEDYESEGAKSVKGGHENYTLAKQGDGTVLTIESDMTEEYFDMMSASWDKALDIIKEMAENTKTN